MVVIKGVRLLVTKNNLLPTPTTKGTRKTV